MTFVFPCQFALFDIFLVQCLHMIHFHTKLGSMNWILRMQSEFLCGWQIHFFATSSKISLSMLCNMMTLFFRSSWKQIMCSHVDRVFKQRKIKNKKSIISYELKVKKMRISRNFTWNDKNERRNINATSLLTGQINTNSDFSNHKNLIVAKICDFCKTCLNQH